MRYVFILSLCLVGLAFAKNDSTKVEYYDLTGNDKHSVVFKCFDKECKEKAIVAVYKCLDKKCKKKELFLQNEDPAKPQNPSNFGYVYNKHNIVYYKCLDEYCIKKEYLDEPLAF